MMDQRVAKAEVREREDRNSCNIMKEPKEKG